MYTFWVDHLLVRVMLQNQLLQEQESPLMINLLPNLHTSPPRILRRQPRTLRALRAVHHIGDDHRLLQDGGGENFFLEGEGHFDTAGVGFGPEEGGGDEADGGEGFGDFFEADGWG